jgi:TRAP-type C4-dicarboxylate transport system permease small subunit
MFNQLERAYSPHEKMPLGWYAATTLVFSSIAVSDFLHVFYEERRTQSNVLTLREEKLEQQSAAN